MTEKRLKWNLPDPDAPGFLRRKRLLTEILDEQPSPENFQRLMKFLADFLDHEPDEEYEAIFERLMECSRIEYAQAIMNILGYDYKITDPKGERSGGR